MDLTRLLDPDRVATMLLAFAPRVLAACLVLAAFWLLERLLRPALRRMLERAGLEPPLIRMVVDNLFRPITLGIGMVMAVGQLGINVTALLAGLSVAGVAVGFAAQEVLANMIAGFMIFMDKPFRVGDWVTSQQHYGRVVEITMRSTRLRTLQNTYVVVPNKGIADAVLVNHTKHGEIRVEVPVGIAYKESIPEARRVILESVVGIDGVMADPHPEVVVTELGNSAVNLQVRVWIDDPAIESPMHYRVMEAAKLALDGAGIQIPFHHLQLFLDNVEEPVWQRLAGLRLAGGGHA